MSGAFVIRNQLGHYWGKSGGWVKGGRAGQVACWTHRDQAVNTLFELGSNHSDNWANYLQRLHQANQSRDPDTQVVKLS